MEPVPVDRRRRRHDAVVVLRIALRLHEPLASAGRAPVEVGILRGHAVHRLRERLAGHGHLVNADVRDVADRLPVQAGRSHRARSVPLRLRARRRLRRRQSPAPPVGSRPPAFPPTNPPPPVPTKASVPVRGWDTYPDANLVAGDGGCVVIAVTRQIPGFFGSTTADSIVVFGSATVARLSHDRTGLAFAIAGFGAVCMNGGRIGAAPRPPASAAPPRATLLEPAHARQCISSATETRQERRSVRSRHGDPLYVRYGSRNGAGPGGGCSHW